MFKMLLGVAIAGVAAVHAADYELDEGVIIGTDDNLAVRPSPCRPDRSVLFMWVCGETTLLWCGYLGKQLPPVCHPLGHTRRQLGHLNADGKGDLMVFYRAYFSRPLRPCCDDTKPKGISCIEEDTPTHLRAHTHAHAHAHT
jgi:hypothetical protein